jgi:GH24 family phage-related lysozyme (muramidase)
MIRQGNIFAPGGSTSDDDLIEWIIREEGFNKVPEDIGDGKMTLGSGLTDPKWHALFKKRGNKWSAADNRKAVAEEVASRRRWAEKNIPNWGNLPDSAQKALISYKYNYDFNAKNSPKLFDALSRGDYREAARQIDATSKNPDFKNGLMKRRRREQAWFLSDFDLPSDIHTLDAEVPYTPMSMLPFSTAVNNPYILPVPEPMMVPREDEYVAVDYDAEQRVREDALRALENQRIVNAIQMMGDWSQKPAPKTEVFQPSGKYNFIVNRNADGGQLNQWDNLSLAEKAEMMKVAIKNGVTDLSEIKERYNEFAEGGNIYDGESEPTQQMKLGRDYWQSQVAKPSWYDTIDPPVYSKSLQEIVVTPTDDQNWLFSQGRYARNSRQPLADESTRKVVAKYLSKYDNEDAAHYNDRVTRLADAIYRTNGVIFKSNNVKEGKFKNRAHYKPNEGIAYVNSMDDLFSELAHPYQDWLGNNWSRDEYVKEYDADIDPRGGTRYAYPDTFEGETHGFFEPALTEYITTGKISRSLPILNKTLSNEKITPKDWKEVTDSATSWDKQAIDRRIISMPSQLPLFDRIKYSVIDYPLLEKNEYSKGGSIHISPSKKGTFTAAASKHGMGVQEFASRVLAHPENYSPAMRKKANFARNSKHWKHGLGGNLFDGLTQPTQQMTENITPWKALENIEYYAIPDTSFTRSKTGIGDIEYFSAEHPNGITYPNGYHRNHPMPGKDVLLYNPNNNDAQDIRLDALHIMPKDATYDVLNTLYREAAKDGDVAYNARKRYEEDLNKYGKENIDSYAQYFNNEADGLLRNMLIEGTPEYIESKRYYPNKAELREWNWHLLPYINNIQNYLETGKRPSNILPEVTVYGKRKSIRR